MNHWLHWPHLIIVPIVLPLMTGAFLLLLDRWAPKVVPLIAGLSTLLGLTVAVALTLAMALALPAPLPATVASTLTLG